MATGVTYEGSSSPELEPLQPKFVCSPCSKDGRNVEAMCRCMNCEENFCSQCLSSHQKFNFTRDHTILQGDEMGNPEKTNEHLLPKERCKEHHSRVMDMFCRDHNLVCCATCIAEHHRDCQDTKYIPILARGMKNSEEMHQVKLGSVEVIAEIKQLKLARENDISRIKNEKEEISQQVSRYKERIIRRLDELGEQAMNEVNTQFDKYKSKFEEDIRRLDELLNSVEQNHEHLDKFASENESQLFVYVKIGSRLFEDVAAVKDELNERCETVRFNLDESSLEYVNKLESIGHVEELNPMSLTLHGKYNVKGDNDTETCDISGCCVMEDDSVVVVDYANNKIVLLNEFYKVIDEGPLTESPIDVCCVGKDKVAVALVSQIQFATVSKTVTLTTLINVEEEIAGIAQSKDNVFVCYKRNVNGELLVLSKTGRAIKTIALHIDNFNPCQLAVTGPNDDIILADEKGRVILLDKGGNVQWTFVNEILKAPLCARKFDASTVLVCDRSANNILQVALRGKAYRIILEENDGMKSPYSMAYDRRNKRLIVVSDTSDDIAVYIVVA